MKGNRHEKITTQFSVQKGAAVIHLVNYPINFKVNNWKSTTVTKVDRTSDS